MNSARKILCDTYRYLQMSEDTIDHSGSVAAGQPPSAKEENHLEEEKNTSPDDAKKDFMKTDAKPNAIRLVHLIVPYLLGLCWTCGHPIVSIVTGELKCRGAYIDENALEPGNFWTKAYPTERMFQSAGNKTGTAVVATASGAEGSDGLCDAVELSIAINGNKLRRVGGGSPRSQLSCLRHQNFDVARIIPASSPVEPSEAIVFVVDGPPQHADDDKSDWTESEFHSSILCLLDRLSDPKHCPWLAKIIYFVSPPSGGKLESTVDAFLDSYIGSHPFDGSVTSHLPYSYSSKMIRSVLVLDVQTNTTAIPRTAGELRIMPQGRRGVLPNLDLVFATIAVVQNSAALGKSVEVRLHPFGDEASRWEQWIKETLPRKFWQYAADLVGMASFSLSLALGPFPPHAPVLDRGIDSLTIQGRFPPAANLARNPKAINPNVAELGQKVELIIRALSNLHERLHHSVTQYLLPSPTKFVSNGEYIYPGILLLVPILVRAASLALKDITRFDFPSALGMAAISIGVTMAIVATSNYAGTPAVMNSTFGLTYITALAAAHRIMPSFEAFTTPEASRIPSAVMEAKRSIQFLTCLLGLYLHVPILLAHVSLAYPSAAFWSPVLAFPTYLGQRRAGITQGLAAIFLILTWPPVLLVPAVFPVYTTYTLVVYTPLHLLLCFLWLF